MTPEDITVLKTLMSKIEEHVKKSDTTICSVLFTYANTDSEKVKAFCQNIFNVNLSYFKTIIEMFERMEKHNIYIEDRIQEEEIKLSDNSK